MHRYASPRSAALLVIGIALAIPQSVGASSTGESDSETKRPAAFHTRVYLGMWTSHVRDPGGGLDANSLLGIAFRGFYGATFVNSYGDRAVVAGIQRSLTAPTDGSLTAALGYRFGLVSGYDERFLSIAGSTPVLPFAQLVGSVDHRQLGVELAYSGLAVSLLVNCRL